MYALADIVRWQWAVDTDFNEATSYKLQADNASITLSEVTDELDGDEDAYTEVSIPMPGMNTVELAELDRRGEEQKRPARRTRRLRRLRRGGVNPPGRKLHPAQPHHQRRRHEGIRVRRGRRRRGRPRQTGRRGGFRRLGEHRGQAGHLHASYTYARHGGHLRPGAPADGEREQPEDALPRQHQFQSAVLFIVQLHIWNIFLWCAILSSCKKFNKKLLVTVLRLLNVRCKDGSQIVA